MMFSVNPTSISKAANRRAAQRTLALRSWRLYTAAVLVRVRALAPYALIELVLPGGSMMALLLWLYSRRANRVGFGPLATRLLSLLRFTNPLRFKARSVGSSTVAARPRIQRASASV